MCSFQQFYLSSADFSWRRSHSPRNSIEINSYYEVGIEINTYDFSWRRSLLDLIPVDATLVKGSHGRATISTGQWFFGY